MRAVPVAPAAAEGPAGTLGKHCARESDCPPFARQNCRYLTRSRAACKTRRSGVSVTYVCHRTGNDGTVSTLGLRQWTIVEGPAAWMESRVSASVAQRGWKAGCLLPSPARPRAQAADRDSDAMGERTPAEIAHWRRNERRCDEKWRTETTGSENGMLSVVRRSLRARNDPMTHQGRISLWRLGELGGWLSEVAAQRGCAGR